MTTTKTEAAAKPARTRTDPELRAIGQIERAVSGLNAQARSRVLRYAFERTEPTAYLGGQIGEQAAYASRPSHLNDGNGTVAPR